MQPKVLVLYNRPVLPPDHPDAGSEHDIVDTMENTVKVLNAAGFAVRQLGIDYDPQPLLDELRTSPPDVVFNLFEGIATQTGTEVSVAALLEWLNTPFTGSPSFTLSVGRDKIRTKYLLAGAGFLTPNFMVIDQLPYSSWNHPWPAIVKPACQDASVGIDQASVVSSQQELDDRVSYVLTQFGPPVLVEEFINGREFHVNIIDDGPGHEPIVLPLAEIAFESKSTRWPIYSFTAKWDLNSEEYNSTPIKIPVEIPQRHLDRLCQIARRSFQLFQCRDYARLDIRMTDSGDFYILELNPNPYLNSSALVSGLAAIGRSHEHLIVNMTRLAAARVGRVFPEGSIQIPIDVSVAE